MWTIPSINKNPAHSRVRSAFGGACLFWRTWSNGWQVSSNGRKKSRKRWGFILITRETNSLQGSPAVVIVVIRWIKIYQYPKYENPSNYVYVPGILDRILCNRCPRKKRGRLLQASAINMPCCCDWNTATPTNAPAIKSISTDLDADPPSLEIMRDSLAWQASSKAPKIRKAERKDPVCHWMVSKQGEKIGCKSIRKHKPTKSRLFSSVDISGSFNGRSNEFTHNIIRLTLKWRLLLLRSLPVNITAGIGKGKGARLIKNE